MADAKSVRLTNTKVIAMILLPSFLWTSLLLLVPYSASFSLLLKIILWGIPAFMVPRLAGNINPHAFFQLNRSPKGKWVLLSAALLVAYSVLLNNGRLEAKPVSLFYILSAIVISPVIEEIAFRGAILQTLHQMMKWAVANAATAILFLLYHIPLWLARGESISLMGCLWVIFFGVSMGYILSRSKSLWTCIIIHAVQNLVFGML